MTVAAANTTGVDGGPSTCRDRQRQVLSFVEDRERVPRSDLIRFAQDSGCPMGHPLPWASLTGLLHVEDDQTVSLSSAGGEWLIEHGRPSPDWRDFASASMPRLRDWQERALQAWCEHGRRGVVQAVTGTGKSRVGVEAIREALAHDYSVVVVVPTVELVEQWVKTLRVATVEGVGASAEGQKVSFSSHPVIVGTVQSLFSTPPRRDDGKVLIVADECHRYGAEQWGRVLHPSYRRRLGLTATFERNDDGIGGLLAYFGGPPVFDIGFRHAIDEGVVAHYDVKLLGVDLNVDERAEYDEADEMLQDSRIRLLAAGFATEPFGAFLHEVQKAAEYDEDPTLEDAARRFLKAFSRRIDVMTGARAKLDAVDRLAPLVAASHGALLFTRRVDVAEDIAESLQVAGVRAQAVHSKLSRTERRERLVDLRARRLKALVAPTVLDEGIDVPDIDLAVVLGGSKSRRQMIQRMGRVLRWKPDGRKATFIVVYARNTAEDLSEANGQEGCLDLIVEAADSVEYVGSVDTLWSAPIGVDSSDGATDPVPPAPPIVEPDPGCPSTPRAGAQPEEPAVEPEVAVDTRVTGLDPDHLPITRRVLEAFNRAHGVTDQEAEACLRIMLKDFQGSCHVVETRQPGVFVAERAGFALALAATRFVDYKSDREDALTWLDYREREVSSGPVDLAYGIAGEPAEEASQIQSPPPVERMEDVVPSEAEGMPRGATDVLRDLERLVEWYESGLLSAAEFAAAKARLLF